MVCYERREAVIPREDIEIAAELDGFTDALVGSELADLVDERDVYIRGVTERITFLEKQSERGQKSGRARREMSARLHKRTFAQQTFDLPLNQGALNGRSISRSTTARTNSPDQAHALDQDPEITNAELDLERSPTEVSQETFDVGDVVLPVGTGNVPPAAANGVPLNPKKRGPPALMLPEESITLAWLLMNHIGTNNPQGRTATMADRKREHTVLSWAATIDRIHRIDKQPWGTIEGMIAWCQRDRFWQTVILGADNLRDKWDKMLAQKQRQPERQQQKRGPTALALDELEQLERAERERGNP